MPFAIFRAASTASVPEFEKKVYCRSPGAIDASSVARSAAGLEKNALPLSPMTSSWALSASTTFG